MILVYLTLVLVFVTCLLLGYVDVPGVKYYFKFGIYYIALTAVASWTWPWMILSLRFGDVRNAILPSRILSCFSNHVLGLRWIMDPPSLLRLRHTTGQCVIVCNHQSSLDLLGLFTIWPTLERCTTVAKKELMFAGPFGLAALLMGTTFIDRKRGKAAIDTLKRTAQWCRRSGTHLFLFPEGTRHHSTEPERKGLLPFKRGAFQSAIASGLPILPVVFSHYLFLDSNVKRFDEGEVRIYVLDPIYTEGMMEDDVDSLMKSTRQLMLKKFLDS